MALGRDPGDVRRGEIVALGLAKITQRGLFDTSMFEVALTERGNAFDEAWSVFGNRDAAQAILRDAYLALPQTEALVQGLHGRQPVKVDGALHLLARHRLADPSQVTGFRVYLQRLNELEVAAYSPKMQTVRVLASVPGSEEPQPTVRVIERDRQYSNVLALRRTLRACRGHIWWADAHFSRKGLEPLVDEADATCVSEIRLLSGPAQVGDRTPDDFKRFQKEMGALGIAAEWRVIEDRADLDFHDRFIVTKGQAWNVPPVNTLFKGDYSEITLTTAPPFESWWAKGKALRT